MLRSDVCSKGSSTFPPSHWLTFKASIVALNGWCPRMTLLPPSWEHLRCAGPWAGWSQLLPSCGPECSRLWQDGQSSLPWCPSNSGSLKVFDIRHAGPTDSLAVSVEYERKCHWTRQAHRAQNEGWELWVNLSRDKLAPTIIRQLHTFGCVSVGKCPHLSVSQALHLWNGATTKQASRVVGRSRQINLQRIRAEPGTDSGFNESALVTLPASPCAAWGGLWMVLGGTEECRVGAWWEMSDSSSDLPPVGLAAWFLPQPHLPQLGDWEFYLTSLCLCKGRPITTVPTSGVAWRTN